MQGYFVYVTEEGDPIGIRYLLSKAPGIEVVHLKDKNKKIRGKGGLLIGWSKGMEGYA